MNTEARVLATLNKIKEVQSKRKDLGAIEDAINEVKSNLEESSFVLRNTRDSLYDETNNVVDQISGLIAGLEEIIADHQSVFNENELVFINTASELDDLGIEYENPFPDVGSDFKDYLNYAKRITSLNLG